MSAVFRIPDTVVATATNSKARTPSTSSTGPENTKALLVYECLWRKSGQRKFLRCRVSDRVNLVKLLVGQRVVTFLSVCSTEWSK